MPRSGIKYGGKIALEKAIERDRFTLRIDGAVVLRGDRKAVMGEFDRVIRSNQKPESIKIEYWGKAK